MSESEEEETGASFALEPINPGDIIVPPTVATEEAMDASKWFKTEEIELDFGESYGRPEASAILKTEALQYWLSQGWYVVSVSQGTGEGKSGKWEDVTSSAGNTEASGASSTSASSSSSANANAGDDSSSSSTQGSSASSGESTSTGSSETTTTREAAYWAVWKKFKLRRRRIQSELVLNDMIAEFTEAYNEGRKLNNDRYNQIVQLYTLMLSRTESEANAFLTITVDDFKPLAKRVTDAIEDALQAYRESADAIPDDWNESRVAEINRRFDAKVAEAKAALVSNGTFNGSVWPAVESGIERDRQYALNDLKDELVTLKVEVAGRIATITADVGNRIIEAAVRIIELQKKSMLDPTELRNNVFKWMLDFMERRDDDYPSLETVVGITDKLGYADGTADGK